ASSGTRDLASSTSRRLRWMISSSTLGMLLLSSPPALAAAPASGPTAPPSIFATWLQIAIMVAGIVVVIGAAVYLRRRPQTFGREGRGPGMEPRFAIAILAYHFLLMPVLAGLVLGRLGPPPEPMTLRYNAKAQAIAYAFALGAVGLWVVFRRRERPPAPRRLGPSLGIAAGLVVASWPVMQIV